MVSKVQNSPLLLLRQSNRLPITLSEQFFFFFFCIFPRATSHAHIQIHISNLTCASCMG